jgi:hypothetical protein
MAWSARNNPARSAGAPVCLLPSGQRIRRKALASRIASPCAVSGRREARIKTLILFGPGVRLAWSDDLRCPKCQFSFHYEYYPGVSLTAVRLGGSRLFRCPHCNQWATFPLRVGGLPAEPDRSSGMPLGLPSFSDAENTRRWFPILILPLVVVVALLLFGVIGTTGTSPYLFLAAGAILVAIALGNLLFGRLKERPPSGASPLRLSA